MKALALGEQKSRADKTDGSLHGRRAYRVGRYGPTGYGADAGAAASQPASRADALTSDPDTRP